jgi:hypothetical protein
MQLILCDYVPQRYDQAALGEDMPFQEYQSCQVGEAGLSLVAVLTNPRGTPRNLRPATSLKIRLGYPDGMSRDLDAVILNDGGDGKMVYVTTAEDLSQAGVYTIQGFATIGGVTRQTHVSSIEAKENIQEPVPPEEP